MKDDLKAYRVRWTAVDEVLQKEHCSASLELRWRQLNAAYGMAKGLGLLKPDPSEEGVYQRWAKLKEKALNQRPKA